MKSRAEVIDVTTNYAKLALRMPDANIDDAMRIVSGDIEMYSKNLKSLSRELVVRASRHKTDVENALAGKSVVRSQ